MVIVPRPVVVLCVLVLATACSTGDGTDLDARTPPASSVDGTSAAPAPTLPPTELPAPLDVPVEAADATTDAPAPVPVTATSAVAVPETGVPGLDSDDAFCAAWSRFAGSFQVIAVDAAFGSATSPESVATLEVLASPTVVAAYSELGRYWPPELKTERDAALDQVYGPFSSRLSDARGSLAGAGATGTQLRTVEAAWVGALAGRDPSSPDVTVELPDDLWALVDRAALDHLAGAGSWFDDESLITSTEIPLTDGYLVANCPDRGTLAGQDADG